MEDNTAEEKQNSLRVNILDKGYDTNKFIEFLKSKKGEDGADITNWTMEDLKHIVKEFISLISKEEANGNNPFQEDNQGNTQTSTAYPSNELNSNSNSNSNNEIWGEKDEDFGIILPQFENCKVCETTELSKYENVQVSINSYKKIDKGIFTKSYFTFLIVTNPLNLNVYRRYSDFDWLR